MGIQVLPEALASQIAAGEVIERPASVVKELIENALDAGATEIKLEIRGGGQRLIRVIDDGAGIPAAEVAVAFERHATSKLRTAEDLFHLHTLGFRGEALPSIGSVAHVTLITRAREEEVGSQLVVDGGRIVSQGVHGSPGGTMVSVEDLFRHVPARKKFLRAATAEAAHTAELVGAYALAYPQVRFSLLNEGRLSFQSPGRGDLRDVLVKVFGGEAAGEMIPLAPTPEEAEGERRERVVVSGFVSPPAVNRATRKHMYLFVNGRWIEDRALMHAVTEAYHTLLMVGRFPIVVLNLTVPPEEVDVNVHPAKSQVRFRDPNGIYVLLQRAVRGALVQYAPVPTLHGAPLRLEEISLRQGWLNAGHWAGASPPASPAAEINQAAQGPDTPGESRPATSDTGLPMLRVLGQVGSTFVLAEGPDGMYIIDQHAAHERILYEKLQAERRGAQGPAQELLEPTPLELTPGQWSTFQSERERLRGCGFGLEEFGGNTILVRAVPALFKMADPRRELAQVLDEMGQSGGTPLEDEAEARLIASICKSAAIKGGQALSMEEMRELVRQLESTVAPRTCPHGRPTVVRFDLRLLEREFGRR